MDILKSVWMMLDTIITWIMSYIWETKKETIPDLDNRTSILMKSAHELAELIRLKQVKSFTVVTAAIERIRAVNPIINGLTDDRFRLALQDAREADDLVRSCSYDELARDKPFLGVPFTVKESLGVHGLFYTLGLKSRRHLKAHADSEPVQLMKSAGAIPIGVSNVPEIDLWQETRNMVYGLTRNPYHTGRSVGGSNGGEAALVSSLCSPFGLCSDLSGSCRMAAAYCGVVSHCATPGTLKTTGVPCRADAKEDLLESSILSPAVVVRATSDLTPLIRVLAGSRTHDFHFKSIDMRQIKFFYVTDPKDWRCSSVSDGVTNAMEKVLERIKEDTHKTPECIEPGLFENMSSLVRHQTSRDPVEVAYLLANRFGSVSTWWELTKKMLGISPHTLSSLISITSLQKMKKEEAEWADKNTNELRQQLLDKLGKNGVLLFPSGSRPAPYHAAAYVRPFEYTFWALANVMGFPATQMPLGLNKDGLPLGIQIMAAPNNDNLCIEVAKYLEQEFGGYVAPCGVTDL